MTQSEEHRFTHLLQPIRDLAANWNINVASELEEYLVRLHRATRTNAVPGKSDQGGLKPTRLLQDALENMTFAFDGGPSLNFAEGEQCALLVLVWGAPSSLDCPAMLTGHLCTVQRLWSSKDRRACMARRWNTCMRLCTKPWSA